MIETKYNVLIGKQVIAKDMTLDNAVIFLKGLFNEYYNYPMLAVTIEVDVKNDEDEIEDEIIAYALGENEVF
jgi:hypothetical protein